MTVKRPKPTAGLTIPDFDRVIVRTRQNAVFGRLESHAGDQPGMAFQFESLAAVRTVPQTDDTRRITGRQL
jgi:hypothetical protein